MKLIALLAASCLVLPCAFVAATSPAGAAATSAAPTTYAVDSVHSSVIFKVMHMGLAPFYGRFNKVTGSVTVDAEKPEASKVELTIAADSVDTNNAGRDTHLKSADFFSAKEFPEIKFASKTVKQEGDKKWKVDGELSLHGVTKPLSLTVTEVGRAESPKGKQIGFDVTFQLKRSDFGMNYGPDALGDEITVMAGIECGAK